MKTIVFRAGQSPEIAPDTRSATKAGAVLIAASKRKCECDILAQAPEFKQRNAALGILDPAEAAALVAHITTCRTAQNAYEAAVQAILEDGELDNGGKLAALDALS